MDNPFEGSNRLLRACRAAELLIRRLDRALLKVRDPKQCESVAALAQEATKLWDRALNLSRVVASNEQKRWEDRPE